MPTLNCQVMYVKGKPLTGLHPQRQKRAQYTANGHKVKGLGRLKGDVVFTGLTDRASALFGVHLEVLVFPARSLRSLKGLEHDHNVSIKVDSVHALVKNGRTPYTLPFTFMLNNVNIGFISPTLATVPQYLP